MTGGAVATGRDGSGATGFARMGAPEQAAVNAAMSTPINAMCHVRRVGAGRRVIEPSPDPLSRRGSG